jgi:hypothetical protein
MDDVRPAPDATWTHCETVEAAWQCVRFCVDDIEEMSLDHDMGDWSPSGYDLLCWMEANDLWPKRPPNVHSANPAGAARMRQVIDRKYVMTTPHAGGET